MHPILRRYLLRAAVALVAVAAAGYMIVRPAPRHAAPLALDTDGVEAPTVVRDRRGRPIIANFRTVEPRLLYRGSAFPTSFEGAGGGSEYADETAFTFLRSLNVRHVVALLDSADAYYAEDGYLRFWSGQTGFEISTTWVQIDPTEAFGRDDRSGLRAAGILIALMREKAGRGGAVYVHDIDGVRHVGVAAAGYELWRNRGWHDFDMSWPLVERRFVAANRTMQDGAPGLATPKPMRCADGTRAFACAESLRSIRDELRFVIEL
ncbi:MAG: hypothetical protein WD690_02480 [Vicinamibacterales bacterium]